MYLWFTGQHPYHRALPCANGFRPFRAWFVLHVYFISMTSTEFLVESTGWIGSAMVVVAYFMNMQGKLSAASPMYKWLNILGSLCLILHTSYHGAYPSAAVNIIWALIGLIAIVRYRKEVNVQTSKD